MVRRDEAREYLQGAMWVLPGASVVAALVAGSVLSLVRVEPGSPLAPLLFQGTADDARALLIGITSTMVTVIALLLGLTVVALQLSSTQFSPRLLRNFLRDRPNQVVLSVFVGTFAYSAAGLYTVGVSAGGRTTEYPRLAVTGAIVLLFLSLVMLVYFAHHMAHSIQVDAIMQVVERNTLTVVRDRLPGGDSGELPEIPEHAVPVTALRSGYVQAVHPETLLPVAAGHRVTILLRRRVGEHVVQDTPLAWAWPPSPADPVPESAVLEQEIDRAVHVGFERTFDQDAAFGIRQLVDVASRALSPAINDPYTAVQAVDHMNVIFCQLAARPLGPHVVRDAASGAVVAVPGRRFPEYLATMCGLVRRYGAHEPIVIVALLRLLGDTALVAGDDADRLQAISEQADILLADAERKIAQPADLAHVTRAAEEFRRLLTSASWAGGWLLPARPTRPAEQEQRVAASTSEPMTGHEGADFRTREADGASSDTGAARTGPDDLARG
jgi:uncharacterized membrane protein